MNSHNIRIGLISSLKGIIITFLTLLLFTTLHFHILSDFLDFKQIPLQYYFYTIVYWFVISAIFIIITNLQIHFSYKKPINRLASAIQKVANGDFSVFVRPLHTSDQYTYIDKMIMDFNKMVEELGSIETFKTELLSNVSHEIKTPLSVINNIAQLLKEENLSVEKRKEYTDTLISTTNQLSELITNILKLNKLENQTIYPSYERYDIGIQICEQILHFENLWEKKDLEMNVDLEENLFITADENLMTSVWNNLLSNAIKFSEQGSTISVHLYKDNQDAVVEISDQGCGMSEETMKHIFDKFYQGDTSHATEGNGLGLPLVKRIIDLLHGTIHVTSEINKGSSFIVRLPLSISNETQKEA